MFNIKIVWQRDCPHFGTVKDILTTHKCMVIVLLHFEKYSRPEGQSLYRLEKILTSFLYRTLVCFLNMFLRSTVIFHEVSFSRFENTFNF